MGTDGENRGGGRINLAKEQDFQLGQLSLSPSSSEARTPDGQVRRVEPRVMEVLVALARAGGHTVTRDELVEACWEGRIVSDDAISRTIAKVRQLARDIDPPPFTVDTVPKIGFRLTVGAAEGAGPEKPAASGDAPERRVDWRRFRAAIVAGGVAAAALVAWGVTTLLGTGKTVGPQDNVDVVLLRTDEQDPELKRLSVLLGDASIRYLTRSSIRTQLAPADGASGAAEFRLAGTLDREGEAYVANMQLIDSKSGFVIWATQVRRDGSRGLDEQFGSTAAATMRCAFDEHKAAPGMSLDVLALFFTTCEAAVRGTFDPLGPARRLVAAAPDLAGAHALLAMSAAMAVRASNEQPQVDALMEESRVAAERALAINPKNAKAHVALGMRLGPFGNWLEREREFNSALALYPDLAPALAFATILHREVGRLQLAAEYGARSLRLADPRAMGNMPNMAFLHAMTDRRQDLEDVYRQMEVMPEEMADGIRWTVDVWWADPRAALADLPALRGRAASLKGADCVEVYLKRLVATGGKPLRGLPEDCSVFPTDWQIRLLSRQGDVEGAYALFDSLPNSRRTTMFLFYPEMKAFRHDKRFMPLMQEIGLLAYWRESGSWPDFCSEPDLPYDCSRWGT